MNLQEAQLKLDLISQQQVLQFWNQLLPSQRESLIKQILDLDLSTFRLQKALLNSQKDTSKRVIAPFTDYQHSGSSSDFQLGQRLIKDGKVGCLIVAGGQGSRLRFEGPKGKYPLTAYKKKSLFQLFAEKVVAASRQSGRLLPLAIMTSPQNHAETVQFFEHHGLFGLSPEQLRFFCQRSLPFLDLHGNLFLECVNKIAEGPDGNGSALELFFDEGIWNSWNEEGVDVVNLVLIDNPLADPFDAELVGFHCRQKANITVKCTQRKHAQENVGVIVKEEGKVKVIEYSELEEKERIAVEPTGSLVHNCANLSLFCFQMDFLKEIKNYKMPLHMAWKSVNCLNPLGEKMMPSKQNAWKFEKFIFDILPYAEKVCALLYPREKCFAPLKSIEGADSVENVRAALQNLDFEVFVHITGKVPHRKNFELAADFYYPTPQIISKWKDKGLPNHDHYIEA